MITLFRRKCARTVDVYDVIVFMIRFLILMEMNMILSILGCRSIKNLYLVYVKFIISFFLIILSMTS